MKSHAALLLLSLSLLSCQSAIRKTVYSAYETVGIEKRDLVKRRADDAREEQKEAGETFQDALERFKSLYAFNGGDLEKQYNKVKDSHEEATKEAADVSESIKQLETVAQDLFTEWEKEASRIETASLRSKSRAMLADTRQKYSSLHSSLKKSEARMNPVLVKFNDQVLYLKHNLNAQAISSLKGEAASLQKEIERLIKDMNASIAEADKFIADFDLK